MSWTYSSKTLPSSTTASFTVSMAAEFIAPSRTGLTTTSAPETMAARYSFWPLPRRSAKTSHASTGTLFAGDGDDGSSFCSSAAFSSTPTSSVTWLRSFSARSTPSRSMTMVLASSAASAALLPEDRSSTIPLRIPETSTPKAQASFCFFPRFFDTWTIAFIRFLISALKVSFSQAFRMLRSSAFTLPVGQ